MIIVTLLVCLRPYVSGVGLKQLEQIVGAMLCIPDGATTLGLSRWTGKGGSGRSLQRFYHSRLDWSAVMWALVSSHLLASDGQYLLAADEVIVSKAGKKTSGVGRFYSSTQKHRIAGLSFMMMSLLEVKTHRSFPLQTLQRQPTAKKKAASKVSKVARPKGRPPGNHKKADPELCQELQLLDKMLAQVLPRLRALTVRHIVLDGFFGKYSATWLIRRHGLHIISKLRYDAALFLPYTGARPKRGAMRKYGDKIDYANLPSQALRSTRQELSQTVQIYHFTALHKDFPDPLNVVVIVHTNRKTNKRGHAVLFSTDLTLSATHIVDFYSLRFQIEFNFRDAKQFWGLDDFMNTQPTAVTNAVYLSFFMTNVAAILLAQARAEQPHIGVLDLKAHYRALRYRDETLRLLPLPLAPDLVNRLTHYLTALGRIHPPPSRLSAA